MAVEKATSAVIIDDLEVSRISLEKAIEKLTEVFKSCPKSTLKRRLKKKAKNVKWPSNCRS